MHFVSESNRGGSAAGDGTAPVLFLDVDGVLTTSRGLLMTYSPGDDTLYHVSDLLPGAAQDSISPLVRAA